MTSFPLKSFSLFEVLLLEETCFKMTDQVLESVDSQHSPKAFNSRTRTGRLRHPITLLTAEELLLGRQIRGLIQRAIENLNEIAGVSL